MKRLISVILIFSLMISVLSGCANSNAITELKDSSSGINKSGSTVNTETSENSAEAATHIISGTLDDGKHTFKRRLFYCY